MALSYASTGLLVALAATTALAVNRDNTPLDPLALDRWWNFDAPAQSEATFRAELAHFPPGAAAYLELTTQLARAQGLQRQFDAANKTLDRVEKELAGQPPRVEVRYLLERGRVFNSSRQPEKAVPLFKAALVRAREAHEDFLAIDAAHMLGIAAPPAEQLKWNLEAVALTEHTTDARSKRWMVSLYNNIGWTYHDAGDYVAALDYFQRALAASEARGNARTVRIARWSVARALRSLRRYDEALAIQQALLVEYERTGETDGYVYEELAEIELARGEIAAARNWFGKAYAALSLDASLKADSPERLERMRKLAENR